MKYNVGDKVMVRRVLISSLCKTFPINPPMLCEIEKKYHNCYIVRTPETDHYVDTGSYVYRVQNRVGRWTVDDSCFSLTVEHEFWR